MSVNILEVGPGSGPAREYIAKIPDPKVTFVGLPGDEKKFDYAREFVGSAYYATGFLEFVNTIALPKAMLFDIIIASNLLNDPGIELTAGQFAKAALNILASDGLLIVEHTTDINTPRYAIAFANAIARCGYKVSINLDDIERFVRPQLRKKNGFSITAVKLGY